LVACASNPVSVLKSTLAVTETQIEAPSSDIPALSIEYKTAPQPKESLHYAWESRVIHSGYN
ncbi:hypothetical protein Tco_1399330, partial [Tanacetum coccineum]